jgi:hypothetical protein
MRIIISHFVFFIFSYHSLLELGSLSRTVHSTNMNAVSSRSHAIFTCHIQQIVIKEASAVESVDNDDMMTSKFHFVDLAGDEMKWNMSWKRYI